MKKHVFLILILTSLFSYNLFAQVDGDFQTRQTGDWDNSDTWEERVSGSWVNTSNIPDNTDGVITILGGHTVSITSDKSLDQLVIQSTATLSILEDLTVNILDGSGTDLINSGDLILLDDADQFGATLSISGQVIDMGLIVSDPAYSGIYFLSGSYYEHNRNGGIIPIAFWNANTTCLITGVTSLSPSQVDQQFGNFIWDCPTQSGNVNFMLSGNNVIQGNFQVINTGSLGSSLRTLTFTSDPGVTLQINGNFEVQSTARLTLTGGGGIVVTVLGDFNTASERLTLGTSGQGNLILRGNFIFTSGEIRGTASTGNTAITIDGSSTQYFTGGGTFLNAVNYIVNPGKDLDLGTSSLGGSGTFTLSSGATLRVGSTHINGALQEPPSLDGNIILEGVRTYTSDATIVYNGAGDQRLGNDFPDDLNLTIANPNVVYLDQNLTINAVRILSLEQGVLDLGNSTLTITGSVNQSTGALRGNNGATLIVDASNDVEFGLTDNFNLGTLTVGVGSGNTVALLSQLRTVNNFNHTSGNIDFSGQALTISGAFAHTGGSFISDNTSTLLINGSGGLASMSFASGSQLNSLTLQRTGSTLTCGSTFTIQDLFLTDGIFSNSTALTMATGGTITRTESGSMINTPGAVTTYDVIYVNAIEGNTGPELPSNTTRLRNIEVDGGDIINLTKAIQINGDLIVSNGTFEGDGFAVDLAGDLNIDGEVDFTTSNFSFIGTSQLSGGGTFNFGDINVDIGATANQSEGSINVAGNITNDGTFNFGSDVIFNGTTSILGTNPIALNNFEIATVSTLTAPAGELTVNGIFTNEGTFNNNSGTVVFNGTNTIGGANNPTFHNIRIEGTLTSPTTLNLNRHFTNNGTFIHNGNTVAFIGTNFQNIDGSATTSFNNISISNTSTPTSVFVNGTANLTGIMEIITTPTVVNVSGGAFTVISGASSDGNIYNIPSGSSIEGSVIVQRYIDPEGRIWRYLSSSVETATVASWQDDFPIIGNFGGASAGGSNPSLYYYDETDVNTIEDGWTPYPTPVTGSNGDGLTPGLGYSAFMNDGGVIVADVSGRINQQNVNIPITFTGGGISGNGYNLVGNPYPSVLDWALLQPDNTFVSQTIAVRNNGEGNGNFAYFTLPNTSQNGGSQYIAMGQSFWVQATSGGTFTFSETHKSTNAADFLRTAASPALIIALENGSQKDEASLFISPDATDSLDIGLDFIKLDNTKFDFSTLTSNGEALAVNFIGEVSCPKSIFLNIEDVENGSYTLSFKNKNLFIEDPVNIIDHFTGENYNVSDTTEISFTITKSNPETFGAERFELVINKNINTDFDVANTDACNAVGASISLSASENEVTYYLLDSDSVEVDNKVGSGSAITFDISEEYLGEPLTVYGQKSVCPEAVFISQKTVANNELVAEISIADNNVLESNYSQGNQWYFNGALLPGETNQQLMIAESGTYSLEVNIGGCTSSANREMQITGLDDEYIDGVRMYPVPVTSSMNIQTEFISGIDLKEARFSLMTIDGKLVYDFKVTNLERNAARIDMSSLNDGVYFIVIETSETKIQRKIIKE